MAAKSASEGETVRKFRRPRASLNPDLHINTSLNSAVERERAVELLGCTRVIQTLREINRPSHLPWQLARLGRCVLAADKSGESLGLTGHTPHQVANNVSGKSELSHICAFSLNSMDLWPYLGFLSFFSFLLLFIFTFTPLLFTVFIPFCHVFSFPNLLFSHAVR